MTAGSLVQLGGSDRASLPDVTNVAPMDTSERAEVTLVLRRRAELPEEIVTGPTVLTSDELAERYGADPADVDLVQRELTSRGLEITAVHPGSRRVKVAGTLGDLSSAFGTTLRQVSSPDPRGWGRVTHRYREGPLYIPAALDGAVVAVLGLDTRPQAKPHFRARGSAAGAAAAAGTWYLPNQVAEIYNFPVGITGAGQTIAVIELGGGFTTGDFDAYFGTLGIAVPSITGVSVDGASNKPRGHQRGLCRGQPGHRRHRRRRARCGAGRVLRAEQRRPGLRRCDLRRRAREPGADRHLDQLGAVRHKPGPLSLTWHAAPTFGKRIGSAGSSSHSMGTLRNDRRP